MRIKWKTQSLRTIISACNGLRWTEVDEKDVKIVQVSVSRLRHTAFPHSERWAWGKYDFRLARRYLLYMKAGKPFSMLEAIKRKDGCYVLVDGNHRLWAIRQLKVKRVPVVVFPEGCLG